MKNIDFDISGYCTGDADFDSSNYSENRLKKVIEGVTIENVKVVKFYSLQWFWSFGQAMLRWTYNKIFKY